MTDVWQYSRWSYVLSRVMKGNLWTNVDAGTITAILPTLRSVINSFWNQSARTGSRPWLETRLLNRSGLTYKHTTCVTPGNADDETPYGLLKMMAEIARDLKKIPMTASEKTQIDSLISATGNRKYGSGPYFGNLI